MPHCECHGGRPGRNHPAVDGDLALGRCVGAGEDVGERRLAVAGDAGEAGDLPREKIEIDAREAGRAASRAVTPSQSTGAAHPGGAPRRWARAARRRPSAPRARPVSHRPSSARPTSLPPRSTTTRSAGARTSLSLCEMKMIDRPRATSLAACANSASVFARRQHRRRLVEDEDPRIAIERLEDLDALALADVRLPTGASGSTARPKSSPRRAMRRARSRRSSGAPRAARCRARCSRARSGCRPA